MSAEEKIFRRVLRRMNRKPGKSAVVSEYEAKQAFIEENQNISRITVSSSGNSRSASFNRGSSKETAAFLDQFSNMKRIKKG